ncbi:hypothetical protein N7462_010181 [Penicillium macrosclerotiorum]|uniref:uncharacterized protein n=1 Tax=Penicillium macrosclerotiorum TaxID=303699 RepID=UPI0025497559|nr:uncharacterized protein N7462_010181 [Penicillium macrosclerotiorum]KAJ5669111.1 hypothetical protein N7462_010181 [Penicillium macrosclerotiorum]
MQMWSTVDNWPGPHSSTGLQQVLTDLQQTQTGASMTRTAPENAPKGGPNRSQLSARIALIIASVWKHVSEVKLNLEAVPTSARFRGMSR